MPGDGPRGDWQPPKPPGPKGPDRFSFGKKLIFTIAAFCGLVLIIIALPLAGITKPLPPFRSFYGLDMWVSPPKLNRWVGPLPRSGKNPSGTFRLEYRLFGLDSDGTGGACMIADIAALVPAKDAHKGEIHEGNCTTKDQCNPKGSSTVIWEGYCVPDGPNQPSRCWYRPTDNDPASKGLLCHTSGNHPTSTNPRGTPWAIGVDTEVPFTPGFDLQTFYQDHTNGKPAQWRVSGLLFRTFGTRHMRYGDPACLSVDQKKC